MLHIQVLQLLRVLQLEVRGGYAEHLELLLALVLDTGEPRVLDVLLDRVVPIVPPIDRENHIPGKAAPLHVHLDEVLLELLHISLLRGDVRSWDDAGDKLPQLFEGCPLQSLLALGGIDFECLFAQAHRLQGGQELHHVARGHYRPLPVLPGDLRQDLGRVILWLGSIRGTAGCSTSRWFQFF